MDAINLLSSKEAKFKDEVFELSNNYQYLGNDAFHLSLDNQLRYFELSNIMIDGIKAKSVEEVTLFLIRLK